MKAPTHNERVLALLKDGKPHTHHELYALHVIAHSRVSDLRNRGYWIEQWRDGDDYCYRLLGRGDVLTAAAPAPGAAVPPAEEPPSPPEGQGPPSPLETAPGQLTLDEVAA